MKTNRHAFLILAGLAAGPMVSMGQTATYEFTGSVTSASDNEGHTIAAGTPVQGTYTFDYDNAVASQSFGTIGMPEYDGNSYGGSSYPLPVPPGFMFTSTVQVGANLLSYATGPLNSYSDGTMIETPRPILRGIESTQSGLQASYGQSYFEIYNADNSNPFANNGLPVLIPISTATGEFYQTDAATAVSWSVEYAVTSLTMVSGPPAILPTVAGTRGSNGWYVGKPSKLEWTVLGGPTPVTSGCGTVALPDTAGTTYMCSATNSLGSDDASILIQKDTVPPSVVVKVPARNAIYRPGQTVLASYACSDATSGVATCRGSVSNGFPIVTNVAGPQSFTVSATDVAGNSVTKTVTYTVESRTATPVFSLKTGTYSGAQTVTLSDATAGAVVYYTLDGTTPTASSPQYAGTPVGIASTETLKALAMASGYSRSAVNSATYTIH